MISEKKERALGSSGSSNTGEGRREERQRVSAQRVGTGELSLGNDGVGLGVQLTFGVSVTQRRFPHVTEAQGAFAATVDKQVAVVGVELGRCDHLRQVLHVGRLDVHDVLERGSRSGKQQRSSELHQLGV